MEKIKEVMRDTGKRCSSCGGRIVETFVKKFGKNNGIIGPGSHTPSWAESVGFGCSQCGLGYGEPVFKKTKSSEQITFELDLYRATLVRKITLNDLFPVMKLVPAGKSKIDIGIQKITFTEMKEKPSKQKVPNELKKLTIGVEVFVLPSEDYAPRGTEYLKIQLTKDKISKTYRIKRSCFT